MWRMFKKRNTPSDRPAPERCHCCNNPINDDNAMTYFHFLNSVVHLCYTCHRHCQDVMKKERDKWLIDHTFRYSEKKDTIWISVKDRLPEMEQDLVVYDKENNMHYAQYFGRSDVFLHITNEQVTELDVTHWVYTKDLPKPEDI